MASEIFYFFCMRIKNNRIVLYAKKNCLNNKQFVKEYFNNIFVNFFITVKIIKIRDCLKKI